MAHFGHQNPLVEFTTHPIITLGVSNPFCFTWLQADVSTCSHKMDFNGNGAELKVPGEVQF